MQFLSIFDDFHDFLRFLSRQKLFFLKFFKFEGDPVAVVVRLRLGPVPVVVAPSGCVFYPVAVCGSGSGFRVSCGGVAGQSQPNLGTHQERARSGNTRLGCCRGLLI